MSRIGCPAAASRLHPRMTASVPLTLTRVHSAWSSMPPPLMPAPDKWMTTSTARVRSVSSPSPPESSRHTAASSTMSPCTYSYGGRSAAAVGASTISNRRTARPESRRVAARASPTCPQPPVMPQSPLGSWSSAIAVNYFDLSAPHSVDQTRFGSTIQCDGLRVCRTQCNIRKKAGTPDRERCASRARDAWMDVRAASACGAANAPPPPPPSPSPSP
eukprot:6195709-Pleurochrysis_carterae.AAC.6